MDIKIKETLIDEAIIVNDQIPEFDEECTKQYYENRYQNKKKLIIIAYIENKPVGYMIGYDKCNDNSFYCWVAGVIPEFRKNGVLNKLMLYFTDWSKNQGYNKITIKTRNKFRAMLSFLVKNNFNFADIKSDQDGKDSKIFLEKYI